MIPTTGTVNGQTVTVCQPADTITDQTITDNGNGTRTETSTTTNNQTGTTTTTTTTTNTTTHTSTTSTSTQPTSPTSAGSGSGDACERNPSGSGCGGEPAAVSGLYEGSGKSLTTVMAAFRTAALATPIGQATNGFFVVPAGGTCPAPVVQLDYLQGSVVLDYLCSEAALLMLQVISGVLMVVASFRAFVIAIDY